MATLYLSTPPEGLARTGALGAQGFVTGYAVGNTLSLFRLYRGRPGKQPMMALTGKFLTRPRQTQDPRFVNRFVSSLWSECRLMGFEEIFFNWAEYSLWAPLVEEAARQTPRPALYALCSSQDELPHGVCPVLYADPLAPFPQEVERFLTHHPGKETAVCLPLWAVEYDLPHIRRNSRFLPAADVYHLAHQRQLTLQYDADWMQGYFTRQEQNQGFFTHVESCESLENKARFLARHNIRKVFAGLGPLEAICRGCGQELSAFLPRWMELLSS
ncbi:MAG: hypothetical protein ACOX7F_01710 [Eubacteriales bacterium]